MAAEVDCLRAFGMCTDLASFYVNLASTLFFVSTIGFLVYDSYMQRKSSHLEVISLKYNNYQSLREHHHDQMRMQIEFPDLLEIFTEHKMPEKYEGQDRIEMTPTELKIFLYYIAEFDLYERVFWYKEDGEIEELDEYEWLTWLIYMEKMSHHWIFDYAYNQTRTIFYPEFMNEIKSKIIDQRDNSKFLEEKCKEAYRKKYGDELEFSPTCALY